MTSGAFLHTFLIHFSGPDQPGLTAELTRVIASYEAHILDIGQAVVHETSTEHRDGEVGHDFSEPDVAGDGQHAEAELRQA